MEKFTVLTGAAAPLLIANLDTDVIIRIERLSKYGRGELGHWALEALRLLPDGSENPHFILNREPFRRAAILLGGENFGCGSSREMAVWALWDRGIRCVIAPSFGDIFFNNCFQNGMLPIRLPLLTIERLANTILTDPSAATMSVDLEKQRVRTCEGEVIPFDVEPQHRQALLEGLDPIELTLKYEHEIAAFQHRDRALRPWLY